MFNLFTTYVDYRTLIWGRATKSYLTIKIDKKIKNSMRIMLLKGKYIQ